LKPKLDGFNEGGKLNAEAGSSKLEFRSQETAKRRLKTENRKQKTENSKLKTVDGRALPEEALSALWQIEKRGVNRSPWLRLRGDVGGIGTRQKRDDGAIRRVGLKKLDTSVAVSTVDT